jgi:N-acetylneuraminic acid mutarotase
MYVYGGSVYSADGTQFTVFDDFWALSTNNSWTKLPSGPSARSGATLWSAGTKLYLFGGIDQTFTTLNDLWSYDLTANKWDEVLANGKAGNPPSRHVAQSGHVASDNRLVLYGGEGDPSLGFPVLADTWEYDLVQQHWTDVTPAAGNITPERNYAAGGVLGGGLYLQGGDIPGGSAGCGAPFPQNPTNELWRFDLTSRAWQQVKPTGVQPVRLKRQASATVGGKLYVVSGWDFQCPGQGQVWNTTTYSYAP